MKDERLEQEFGEYFKGVNTPADITGDAKKLVKPKRNVLPKIVKFASIAASFVIVFAVALIVVLKTDFNKGDYVSPPSSDFANNSSSPSDVPDWDDGTHFRYYTEADLTVNAAEAHSLSSLNKSLKFIENFAIASNASVNLCETGYDTEGNLALARANVSLLNGLSRDETKIFVEFTDADLVYGELSDYYDGQINSYRGAEYYLTTSTAENGELKFKLHVSYKGVKYYFDVTSSDERAYQRYLNLIVK